jgi:nickel transport protein
MRIHKAYRKAITLLTLTVIVFSCSGNALAHRVTVFAWVEGDTVFTESKFGAGQPVKDGEILVLDEAGNRLLTGKTDNEGEFSFPIPQKSALKVVLNASMGHRAEWFIPLRDVDQGEMMPSENVGTTAAASETRSASPATASPAELEKIVEKVLDRKLKPIHRMLADIGSSGPSFRDIFGGIGYIFGLMGVAAWFRYRH